MLLTWCAPRRRPMNRQAVIALLRTSAIVVLGLAIVPKAVPAGNQQGGQGGKHEQPPPPYNPYPPGILPADLESELDRVRREVTFIFVQALAQWRALPPPNLTGQPPTLQGSGYDMVQTLGKLMNYDLNMSPFKNVACASCHLPYSGFSGPIPSVNLTMIAYPGSFRFRAGKRTAQRYSRDGSPRHGLHRIPAFPGRVPTSLRTSVGQGLARHQVPARHRGDLRNPGRGCAVRHGHYASKAEPRGSHPRKQGIR